MLKLKFKQLIIFSLFVLGIVFLLLKHYLFGVCVFAPLIAFKGLEFVLSRVSTKTWGNIDITGILVGLVLCVIAVLFFAFQTSSGLDLDNFKEGCGLILLALFICYLLLFLSFFSETFSVFVNWVYVVGVCCAIITLFVAELKPVEGFLINISLLSLVFRESDCGEWEVQTKHNKEGV